MGLTWKQSAGFGSTYTETGPIHAPSTSSRCTPSTYTMLHVSYISIKVGGKLDAEWGGGYLEAYSAGQSDTLERTVWMCVSNLHGPRSLLGTG